MTKMGIFRHVARDFGNFAPPPAKSGGWRRFAELEKPAIGGPFYEYQGHFL
jgi:hypothetical protein